VSTAAAAVARRSGLALQALARKRESAVANVIAFVFFILNGVLSLLCLAIIAAAIMSWLVAFNVVNSRNTFVYQLERFLDAVTAPVLGPIQRIMPSLGGVDISPVIALLVIRGVQIYLLPPLQAALMSAVGTPVV
jgi:YggT family protein